MSKPDCYSCKFKRSIPGDTHLACMNSKAKVEGNTFGKNMGFFFWPFNFDPIWLLKCDGFKDKEST